MVDAVVNGITYPVVNYFLGQLSLTYRQWRCTAVILSYYLLSLIFIFYILTTV